MRLVIEAEDFKTLSTETQHELLRCLAGDAWAEKRGGWKKDTEAPEGLAQLSPEHAARLVDGLPGEDRRMLQMFAERGGRVEASDLLAVAGPGRARAVEEFGARMQCKLEKLGATAPGEPLFTMAQADGEHVFRTSGITAQSLRCCFPLL